MLGWGVAVAAGLGGLIDRLSNVSKAWGYLNEQAQPMLGQVASIQRDSILIGLLGAGLTVSILRLNSLVRRWLNVRSYKRLVAEGKRPEARHKLWVASTAEPTSSFVHALLAQEALANAFPDNAPAALQHAKWALNLDPKNKLAIQVCAWAELAAAEIGLRTLTLYSEADDHPSRLEVYRFHKPKTIATVQTHLDEAYLLAQRLRAHHKRSHEDFITHASITRQCVILRQILLTQIDEDRVDALGEGLGLLVDSLRADFYYRGHVEKAVADLELAWQSLMVIRQEIDSDHRLWQRVVVELHGVSGLLTSLLTLLGQMKKRDEVEKVMEELPTPADFLPSEERARRERMATAIDEQIAVIAHSPEAREAMKRFQALLPRIEKVEGFNRESAEVLAELEEIVSVCGRLDYVEVKYGELLAKVGLHEKAEEVLERHYRTFGEEAGGLWTLANVYAANGKVARLEPLLELLERVRPSPRHAAHCRMIAAHATGNVGKQLEQARLVRKLAPEDMGSYVNLSAAIMEYGMQDRLQGSKKQADLIAEAVEVSRDGLRLAPENAFMNMNLAASARLAGDVDTFERHMHKALQGHLDQESFMEAREAAAMLVRYARPQRLVESAASALGFIAVNFGGVEATARLFDDAIERFPESRELKNFREALERQAAEAEAQDPNHID